MGKITWLNDNGVTKVEEREAFPSLEELQDYVGGYIETVPLSSESRMPFMYVNEEGLLDGMPYNMKASEIYQKYIDRVAPGHVVGVVGPAVMFEGEFIGLA